ncbi:MAG TPA: succinate dehydrogenase assembly factor 2 [Steroidobacteraceae bacterium]|nr:succinate dehydrogenase assembly factor 2 [Steroidobacteraceae bacterium]
MTDPAAGRLVWRCRRGMKELDLVLMRYLQGRWQQADARERSLFEQILDLPDPLLAAYLMGRESASDREMQGLLDVLRGDPPTPVAGIGSSSAPGAA